MESREKEAGSGIVRVRQGVVGVIATSRHGVTEGPTGGLVGDVGMEGHQILPDMSLNIAAADLGPFHHVATGVGSPTVRAIVHFTTAGEEQAGAGEGETLSSKKCGVGTIPSVLTQEVTLVHDIDVGNDGQYVLLKYLTGLTFGSASSIREP